MPDINYLAVVAAALSAFLLGGLWYSPVMFFNAWAREMKVNPAEQKPHGPKVFAISFFLSLISAAAFAWFLGPNPAFMFAMGAGFGTGLCWVAASFGINYQFAGRSFILLLIDGGYHTVQFTLYGLILGLWH